MDKAAQIILRDPSELKVHPALKHVPELAKDSPEFISMLDDIRLRGIDQAIFIVGDQIIEGRHRWRAAKRLQLPLIPVIERREDEIAGIIINSLVQRRHYTKGALAYMTVPMMEEAFEEAKKREISHRFGQPAAGSAASALPLKSVEDLAETIGISRRLFFQARELHEEFEKKPKLREQFEQKILSGEVGLGGVLAGIAGQQATKRSENGDQGKAESDQLELFGEAFGTLTTRFKYWAKFDADSKEEAVKAIRRTVSHMPDDLREEFSKALKAVEKEKAK